MKKSALVDIHKSLKGIKGALKELKPDGLAVMGTVASSAQTMGMLMGELKEQGKQYKKV